LVFRRADERELDEELRFHVEMEAEYQRRAGANDVEARRRGALQLGGVERVKEDVRDARGTRLIEDLARDLAFAARTLARDRGFTVVACLTLAVGIGATTAVFSAVDAVLLRPLPYQQPGQLVRLYQTYGKYDPDDKGFVTPVHFLAFRRDVSSFAGAAAIGTYNEVGADIGSGNAVRRIRLLPTSAGYFDVMRVPPRLGHGFGPGDETGALVVVLSDKLWREQFAGDPGAVGRTLRMNDQPYVVAGIMPPGFTDPVAGAVDAWVPMDLTPGKDPGNASNHYLTMVARLRPGVSIARAQAELNAVNVAVGKQFPAAKDKLAHLYPLKDDIVGSSSRALELMLGAAALVLVLVCVNVANLLLVRGSERAREFAVRSALGAERARLVRQMLTESLLLALAGDAAGLVVARVAMSAIVALGAGQIPRLDSLSLDPRLLAFSVLVATGCAVLFGMAPAIRAGRTQPSDVLRDQTRSMTGGRTRARLREWLVVSQVALAFVLLVGAGLLLSSVERIREVDLGVRPDGVLTFELHLPSARYDSTARGQFYDDFAQRIARLPGVRAAGAVSKLPATGDYHVWGTEALTGPFAHKPNAGVAAQNRVVAGDYFRAAGIPLLAGRFFDWRDAPGVPDHLIVSKSLADRLFPHMSALGQQITTGRAGEIVGVVGDVSVDNEGKQDLYAYHAHRQFAGDRNWALTQVVATTRDAAAANVEPSIRGLLAERDPRLVMYKPMWLDDAIGLGAAQRVFTLRLLAAFAVVAVLLSALGLFGVLSYGVRLRGREFGIRLALGAEPARIRRMVLARGLVVSGAGIAAGLIGAAALSRVMTSQLFHVKPLDPGVIAAAAGLMAVVAGVAAYLPARRATAADPREALQ
jgi:predicted permease